MEAATISGLPAKEFTACLSDEHRFDWRLLQDKNAGETAGISGTPFTVVLRGKNKVSTISGAVTAAELEKVVQTVSKK